MTLSEFAANQSETDYQSTMSVPVNDIEGIQENQKARNKMATAARLADLRHKSPERILNYGCDEGILQPWNVGVNGLSSSPEHKRQEVASRVKKIGSPIKNEVITTVASPSSPPPVNLARIGQQTPPKLPPIIPLTPPFENNRRSPFRVGLKTPPDEAAQLSHPSPCEEKVKVVPIMPSSPRAQYRPYAPQKAKLVPGTGMPTQLVMPAKNGPVGSLKPLVFGESKYRTGHAKESGYGSRNSPERESPSKRIDFEAAECKGARNYGSSMKRSEDYSGLSRVSPKRIKVSNEEIMNGNPNTEAHMSSAGEGRLVPFVSQPNSFPPPMTNVTGNFFTRGFPFNPFQNLSDLTANIPAEFWLALQDTGLQPILVSTPTVL